MDANSTFYVCSLIEYIGRKRKLRREDVVAALGAEALSRIYRYADTFHCEPIGKVADDFIRLRSVPEGDFDNVAACRYDPPDYWTRGAVFGRLADDTAEARPPAEAIAVVYASPVGRALSNYNTDLFYQSRDYLKCCFDAGRILEDE